MLKPSILFALSRQIEHPSGFWVSAGDSSFCKRVHPEMRSAADCDPLDVSGAVPAVTAPAVSSSGGHIPKSELHAIRRMPAPRKSKKVAIASLSSALSACRQDIQQSGVSVQRLGVPSLSPAVDSGAFSGSSLGRNLTDRV